MSSCPQLYRWPFYGHALEVIRDLPEWPRDELSEFEKAVEHRGLVEKHLRQAEHIVAMLKNDLAAIDAVYPSEIRS